jgi:predicted transcriptional regulator
VSAIAIRLPEELKGRVAAAAKRAGSTTHAFIPEAIAEKTAREEQRADFVHEAQARYARIVASGETISWQDMRRCPMSHIADEPLPLPTPRKVAR